MMKPLRAGALVLLGMAHLPGGAQPAGAAAPNARALFAGKCSWCHAAYGMEADKGPRLAGTTLSDAELEARIRLGVPGAMPGFGQALSDAEIAALIRHIRSLNAP